MKGIKSLIGLILLLSIPFSAFSETTPIQSALDSIASDHYSAQLNTIVGNFTWEDSGIGTGFSPVLRGMVEKAVKESASYTIVKHTGPVFNDPVAAMLMGSDATSGAGYMIYGTYRLEGNKIIVDLNVFSFIFSSLVGSREITLPLNSVPSGVQIIPENPEVIADVDSLIGTLYGESDLDVFVTTSRGEGGVYHDGEELLLYILASKDCYIKIFHIDVTGRNTVQIFPNSYEVNNYLPGDKLHVVARANQREFILNSSETKERNVYQCNFIFEI